MLWFDLTNGREVRVCKNEKCRKEFLPDRVDQIYCDPRCGQNVAKRRYYETKGRERRREAIRKAKRRSSRRSPRK